MKTAITVAFGNKKGGVGKTTTTAHFAAALKRRNKKVLLVDLDSQGNLSKHFGVDTYGKPSIVEFLLGQADFPFAMIKTHGVDLIPGDNRLADLENTLANDTARRLIFKDRCAKELVLKTALSDVVKQYDFVLFDCPPSDGLITFNALAAVDHLIIPFKPDLYSIWGATDILKLVDLIKDRGINKDLEASAMLCNEYDQRQKIDEASLHEVRRIFGKIVLSTIIRRSVDIKEAAAAREDVFTFYEDGRGAEDFEAATREILRRIS